MMRAIALVLSVLVLSGTASWADETPVPLVVKEFRVQPLFGPSRMLYDSSTKGNAPTILHFWATWCGPCREEMPKIMAFSKENPDVMIAVVAMGESIEDVTRYLTLTSPCDRGGSGLYFVATDQDMHSELGDYYIVSGIPTTILVNANGTIAGYITGGIDWQSGKVKEMIKNFREGKPFEVVGK